MLLISMPVRMQPCCINQYQGMNCLFVVTVREGEAIPFSGDLDFRAVSLVRSSSQYSGVEKDSVLYIPLLDDAVDPFGKTAKENILSVRFKPVSGHSGVINIFLDVRKDLPDRIELDLTDLQYWHRLNVYPSAYFEKKGRPFIYYRPPASEQAVLPMTTAHDRGDDPDRPYWLWNYMHRLLCQRDGGETKSVTRDYRYQALSTADDMRSLAVIRQQPLKVSFTMPEDSQQAAVIPPSNGAIVGHCNCCVTIHVNAVLLPSSSIGEQIACQQSTGFTGSDCSRLNSPKSCVSEHGEGDATGGGASGFVFEEINQVSAVNIQEYSSVFQSIEDVSVSAVAVSSTPVHYIDIGSSAAGVDQTTAGSQPYIPSPSPSVGNEPVITNIPSGHSSYVEINSDGQVVVQSPAGVQENGFSVSQSGVVMPIPAADLSGYKEEGSVTGTVHSNPQGEIVRMVKIVVIWI